MNPCEVPCCSKSVGSWLCVVDVVKQVVAVLAELKDVTRAVPKLPSLCLPWEVDGGHKVVAPVVEHLHRSSLTRI